MNTVEFLHGVWWNMKTVRWQTVFNHLLHQVSPSLSFPPSLFFLSSSTQHTFQTHRVIVKVIFLPATEMKSPLKNLSCVTAWKSLSDSSGLDSYLTFKEMEKKSDLKGTMHPKMKILSSSTHHHADGKLGEDVLSAKLLWSFTELQHSPKQRKKLGDLFLLHSARVAWSKS